MTEDRPIRLELAPPYLEVWERDGGDPELYHFEGETLSADALTRRADTSPGLTVVRVSWRGPAAGISSLYATWKRDASSCR